MSQFGRLSQPEPSSGYDARRLCPRKHSVLHCDGNPEHNPQWVRRAVPRLRQNSVSTLTFQNFLDECSIHIGDDMKRGGPEV